MKCLTGNGQQDESVKQVAQVGLGLGQLEAAVLFEGSCGSQLLQLNVAMRSPTQVLCGWALDA